MADTQSKPRGHGRNWTAAKRSLYFKWTGMHRRCSNPRAPGYANYGGRGLTVCTEWDDFKPFMAWALANGWRPGLWIERKNNNEGYSPDNCCFATPKENNNNRRDNHRLTWRDRTLTISQWADELGVRPNALLRRLGRGWPIERVLTQPFQVPRG